MMTSQILKSVDFTKTQKPRYLDNETFLLQIKKFIYYTSRDTLLQKNNFVAEVTFKGIVKWDEPCKCYSSRFKDTLT